MVVVMTVETTSFGRDRCEEVIVRGKKRCRMSLSNLHYQLRFGKVGHPYEGNPFRQGRDIHMRVLSHHCAVQLRII